MKDIFYEESAKTIDVKSARFKYNACNIVSILSIVALVCWIYLLLIGFEFGTGSLILNIIIISLPTIMFLSSAIILGIFKNRFYVDYDYTFISGQIRISKVVKEIKRYECITFECREIEKIGKYGSESYKRIEKMTGVTKMILTSNNVASEDKEFFYMTVNRDGKKLLVFECSKTFISNVLQFTGRLVLEEGFK